MRCLDCSGIGAHVAAVGICAECGAASAPSTAKSPSGF